MRHHGAPGSVSWRTVAHLESPQMTQSLSVGTQGQPVLVPANLCSETADLGSTEGAGRVYAVRH